MKKIVITPNAPAPIGPYSQAVEAGNTLYLSGQLPIDPATGEFAGPYVAIQTEQALKNIGAILNEAGYSYADVVKCIVYLSDISDFAEMNEAYAKYFTDKPPARSAFAVENLPKNALVEIEAIAYKA